MVEWDRPDLFVMPPQDLVWWQSLAFANYIISPFVSLFPPRPFLVSYFETLYFETESRFVA